MTGIRSFRRCSRYGLELDFELFFPTKIGFVTSFQLTTALAITFFGEFVAFLKQTIRVNIMFRYRKIKTIILTIGWNLKWKIFFILKSKST